MTGLPGSDPDDAGFEYDEFAYFAENCDEYDLDPPGEVRVERLDVALDDGRRISALRWGSSTPRAVLVHGGAQNAHTWDTVALALRDVPVLAIDLPGHGRSSWRPDGTYSPSSNAADLAPVLGALAPDAPLLVGMSLGGLTSIVLAARHPGLVSGLVAVDITPGVTRDKAADVHAFIEGPQRFDSFEDIFRRTVEHNPTRSAASLRRGILHNAHRLDDGGWSWNYDRGLARGGDRGVGDEREQLWEDVSAVPVPLTLVRGALSPVVDDDDVEELRRRQPGAEVIVVDGAGHSVQGDRPLELASIISERLP